MKNLMLAVVMVAGASAFAQEIGSEIKPGTTTDPKTGTTTTYDNPYATPPPPPNANPNALPANATQTDVKLSAGKGAFGVRAGFGGGGLSLATGTGATASTVAPQVGLTYWASDGLSLLFDVGFGMIFANNVLFALGVGIGIDYHGRTTAAALRPLFNFGVALNFATAGNNLGVGMQINLGGGAEYFLSPNFAIRGTLGLGVPIAFSNNVLLGIFTFTPGVAAAFYF